MLKIITGNLKGRIIPFLKGGEYRPSTNKFREALFSILSSGIFADMNILSNETSMLDICSGTGAVSFEAISRGVSNSLMIDQEIKYLKLAQETAEKFQISHQIKTMRADVNNLPPADQVYNLVFIDPPYNHHQKMIQNILTSLITKNWLAKTAVILIESEKKTNIPELKDYDLYETRIYGNSKLSILIYEQK